MCIDAPKTKHLNDIFVMSFNSKYDIIGEIGRVVTSMTNHHTAKRGLFDIITAELYWSQHARIYQFNPLADLHEMIIIWYSWYRL